MGINFGAIAIDLARPSGGRFRRGDDECGGIDRGGGMSVRVWSMCPFRCGRAWYGAESDNLCTYFFFWRVEGLFPRLIVAVSA